MWLRPPSASLCWPVCSNAKGSFWSIVAGIVVALIWVLAGLNESINVVYPTIIVCYIVGVIVSLTTNKQTFSAQ